jgi:amino acid carrier protein
MELFNNAINSINSVIWSTALVVFLVCVGIYFTFRTKGFQFRRIADMCRLLGEHKEESEAEGLSSFQAFAATVGSRVGMGNIAGVATAIFFGGPGAVVWMWITALIGACTACIESTIGQMYKDKNMGELIGGPQYYMEKGLHCRAFGIAFAIATLIGPGLLMPALQTQSTAIALKASFGLPMYVSGILICICLGLVVVGGIQRIGKVAELLAPVMCIVYLVCGLIIMITHASAVPGAFALMFRCAFAKSSMYAGITGSMIAWGVKRGLYSNDAGDGMGPILSSTAECSHPVKQGLVQGLSVYIDTIIVCSVTAVSLIVTGLYNVSANAAGTKLITEGLPGYEYGVNYMQQCMIRNLGGNIGGIILAVLIAVFVFTTLMSYYYQMESNLRFLFGENKKIVRVFQVIYLFANFLGVMVNGQVIWSMGDTGAGLMAWFNLIAIVLLSPVALKAIKDYDRQKKLGLDPMYDPATVGLEDKNGIWTKYVEKKKARGDYENPQLGYSDIKKSRIG